MSSTALSMHTLRWCAVCPSPSQVSSAPGSCRAGLTAQVYGVAGSRVVPITNMGGAPGARAGAGVSVGGRAVEAVHRIAGLELVGVAAVRVSAGDVVRP